LTTVVAEPENSNVEKVELDTPEGMTPERIDRYLGTHPNIAVSRTRIQRLIEEGLVTVNGAPVNVKYKLRGGEAIVMTVPVRRGPMVEPEDIPLEIVHEDEHLAVINKPAGLVVHPGVGNYTGTLVHALVYHFKKLAGEGKSIRPGIVHRLDKNTCGLMVVAKTDPVFEALQEAIKNRDLKRVYLALACGHMKDEHGFIEAPIGRSTKDRMRMMVTDKNSREARTEYRLKDRFRTYDLLEVTLHTGRTHQIRVHLSHIGHPVFGDPAYGGRDNWHKGIFAPERPLGKELLEILKWQALQAKRIAFDHPVTGEKMTFTVDPPEELQKVLDTLDRKGR
jgi:23S rRNA pseudouridine1911/1915/1917 synthase